VVASYIQLKAKDMGGEDSGQCRDIRNKEMGGQCC